jgi:hypothetical protein
MWKKEIQDFIDAAIHNQCTESSQPAEQPSWITTPLRPHQMTLLRAAQQLETQANAENVSFETPKLMTTYGVLADRVGAGKSLVVLSLLRDPPPQNVSLCIRDGTRNRDAVVIGMKRMAQITPFVEEWRTLNPTDLFEKFTGGRPVCVKPALIIVPHNVCLQWEAYVKEHTTLNICMIKRTKDCDYEREGFYADIFMSDAVIVSSTMLRKFQGAMGWKGPGFAKITWSRLFVDEADTIACSIRYGEIASRFTWFVTGSWLNMLFPEGMHAYTFSSLPQEIGEKLGSGGIAGVQSQYGFIANTLSRSRYPAFGTLILRNSDAWINASLSQPVVIHETILCKTPQNLNILKGFITPEAMEALHAGDTTGAMVAMGLKSAPKETLVDRVSASLRNDLVQAEKILEFKKTMDYSSPSAKAVALEKAEQKIVRIQEQLVSLEARIAQVSQEVCPICYDSPRSPTLTPCCRNSFCLSCLCECIAAKPACPLCRQDIGSVSNLIVIGDGTEEVPEAEDPLPTKGAALLKLLESAEADDKRYLVFSAHEASFKGLRELLASRGIRSELLFGSGARVERLRKQFRDGTVRVLCMNARHVGAGINLEATSGVILYHRMNTELEKQVIGRAIRFERTSELRVYHLVHEQETHLNGAASSNVIMHV